MREQFEYEGTATGEYKSGMYVTYDGNDYPAVYLGYGRFVIYSDTADANFTFPTTDGRYLLQTDIRDELLTKACEIRMIGIVKDNYENVRIREIFEEGVVISTYNPRLAFELHLQPIKELGFTGMVDRNLLLGIFEERDYLWSPQLGFYSTFCQAVNASSEDVWMAESDRYTKLYVLHRDELSK